MCGESNRGGGGGGGEVRRYEVDEVIRHSWPVKFRKMQKMSPFTREGRGYDMAMESKAEAEKVEYPDDVKHMVSMSKPPHIEIGKPFDLLSLLSFNGMSNYLIRNTNLNPNHGNRGRVELNKDTFKGKHIMVCCFQAPMFRFHDLATDFQSLADICYEMYNNSNNDFEMVLVVKMSAKANYRRVFDHFLSAFPCSCLVVPFNDPKRRDYICHYLDLSHMCACLIVDSSGIVLLRGYPNFAMDFGSDAFPFTDSHQCPISAKDEPIWESPSTTQLEQLLGCSASYRLYKVGGTQEAVSVSKLNEKVVGLYLLVEGSFMSKLYQLYQECTSLELEFEIIVVYIPFADCLHPEAYQRKVDGYMKKRRISWWRMPFNNSKCRRLWRLCEYSCDQLVIVGPHNDYVVPYGREALRNIKGVDAYPFRDLCNFKPIL